MTMRRSWWFKTKRAWSKWLHNSPPLVPPGFPSQAEIEANTSGYAPGGWDVTANRPRTEHPTDEENGGEN